MIENTTMREYVAQLRRYWILIVGTTVLAAALALSIAVREPSVYSATTSVELQDENSALSLLGMPVGATNTPEQRAALGARTLVSPDVMRRVQERLKSKESPLVLRGRIRVNPDAETSLVVIEARAEEPEFAAELSNVTAQTAVEAQQSRTRASFDSAARQLQQRLAGVSRSDPSRVVFAERISQLEALASLARPARVAADAAIPNSRVSPQPARNAVIGGFLGLLLALGIAAVHNALDRRVRGVADLHELLDLPIIGRVPAKVLGQAGLRTSGSGSLTPDDFEPFRIMRRNLEFLEINGGMKTIAITSALPQEGKSTVAASLAYACASAGRRTVLVEGDLRRPVLAERMQMEGVPGLAEYLAGAARTRDVIRTASLSDNGATRQATGMGPAGIDCIFAGKVPNYPSDLLSSPRFPALLDQLKKDFDIVIIDTSPLLLVADTLEILPHVDGVVLCARSSQTTREQALAARDVLANLPSKPTGLVVTGTKLADEGAYGYYGYTSKG